MADYIETAWAAVPLPALDDQTPDPAVATAAPEYDQPVAYVAGPYRDPRGAYWIERNIRAAEAVAVELWRMGFAVVCPHTNTRMFDGAAPDEVWLRGDIAILARCDLVVTVPGWVRSVGAQNEVKAAAAKGIPVFHWDRDAERGVLEEVGKLGRAALADAAGFRGKVK